LVSVYLVASACLNNNYPFWHWEQIRKNKLIYQDKPRLKTALELLRTSMDVEDSLSEVLNLQGAASMTCPALL
jgi:hypothetical protein